MPIPITCGSCGTKLKAPESAAGRKVKCPKCSTPAVVPNGVVAAAPAAASKKANKAAAPAGPTATATAPAVEATTKRRSAATASTPPRPAENGAADSGLLAQNSWMIRKKERFLFPQFFPLQFDFFRPGTKEVIGSVTERVPFWGKLLRGFNRLRNKIPIRYEVTDAEGGPVLFTVRNPGSFTFSGILINLINVTTEVLDADDRLIGSFVFSPFALAKHFTLTDPQGNKMAEFRFKLGEFRPGKQNAPPRMSLVSLEGQEWGSITGENEAELMQNLKDFQDGTKKMVTRVKFLPPPPGMLITINPEAPDQHLAKILLLSAAVAMKRFKKTAEMFQRG